MLKRVDRVQIVVRDRAEAQSAASAIFGAEFVRDDEVNLLGARRTVCQVGASILEFLEANGAGRIADFARQRGGGLYAAGFSVAELEEAAALFNRTGIKFEREGGQLFLDSMTTCGMPTVVSTFQELSPVGAIKWMYEVTNVVADWRATAERYTRIFGLDSSKYVPIEHADFGYTGTLTMFDAPARLDRIEISQPTRAAAMGSSIADMAIRSICSMSRPTASRRSPTGCGSARAASRRARKACTMACGSIRRPFAACWWG